MGARAEVIARSAFALAAVGLLFLLRWDTSIEHFDWQVWEASNNLLDDGANPYDHQVLNEELQQNPQEYGPHFDSPSRYVYLFSPPTWLATVRLLTGSALVMSLAGAVMVAMTMVALTIERSWEHLIGAVLGFVVFVYLGPGLTTFRLGQTGLFLAGLVGAQILLARTATSGVPTAVMSFKPHIALAAGIPDLVRKPKETLAKILIPYALLIAATVALLGVTPWRAWIEFMTSGAGTNSYAFDLTLSTLSSALPWGDLGLATIVIAALASAALSWHCRHADRAVLLLASLGIMAFLAGHAFVHDWLWVCYVPVVLAWNPLRSALGMSLLGLALSVATQVQFPLLNPQAVIGGFIAIGLTVLALRASQPTHDVDERAEPLQPLVSAQR